LRDAALTAMRLSRGYGAVDLADQSTEGSHHKTAPSPF
jgi:hypothetical protein